MDEKEIQIPIKGGIVAGDLTLFDNPKGIVIFAHGSGSSRHSARNKQVATQMHDKQIATLLFDLLTLEEEKVDEVTKEHRFNIELLGSRLCEVIDWVAANKETKALPIALFGSSTGAAAALIGAARKKAKISAVVSRGGRPDLAVEALPEVQAPTLLIVGGLDDVVIGMNEEAFAKLKCKKSLQIVEGASHLFEESGKLEIVSQLAINWFLQAFAEEKK
jgi:putative phosphoribosyl transferase